MGTITTSRNVDYKGVFSELGNGQGTQNIISEYNHIYTSIPIINLKVTVCCTRKAKPLHRFQLYWPYVSPYYNWTYITTITDIQTVELQVKVSL